MLLPRTLWQFGAFACVVFRTDQCSLWSLNKQNQWALMGWSAAMQQDLTIWCMPLLWHAQFATGFHFHNEWCTNALGDKSFNPWLLKTAQNKFFLNRPQLICSYKKFNDLCCKWILKHQSCNWNDIKRRMKQDVKKQNTGIYNVFLLF